MCDFDLIMEEYVEMEYALVTLAVCKRLCSTVHDNECSGIMYDTNTSICYVTSGTGNLPAIPGMCGDKPTYTYFQRKRHLGKANKHELSLCFNILIQLSPMFIVTLRVTRPKTVTSLMTEKQRKCGYYQKATTTLLKIQWRRVGRRTG